MMMIDLKNEIDQLLANNGMYYRVFPGYITHIRFPRYKNITPGSRVNFDFPITALVGANGSGKTSVLNALYGAPIRNSTGQYWFSTKVDPIEEGEGSPNRFIYGHFNQGYKNVVETRKARVKKIRNGREDPNYWEPTKESPGDNMLVPKITSNKKIEGRSLDRWNPVSRKVLYINFRKELSAFDKYFYFGKEPGAQPQKKLTKVDAKTPKVLSSRRILNKMDQVRHDAHFLAQVIAKGDTSKTLRGRKIATENRLLTQDELQVISFILGRDYSEARWIRHRLFKGDGGLSIVFKTKHGQYSEAFAGSGEVAVASCVVQILAVARGTLVLLDEPEVSLHPGAQERLLAFLVKMARQKQIQVVFSTHSPHLISALPDYAIKSFYQSANGGFSMTPSTHPYAAFRRLGVVNGQEILVIVEDRLAQSVVNFALASMGDAATSSIFRVEYVSGGADSILAARIPVFMEGQDRIIVLLDGDKKKVDEFLDPDAIPSADNENLESKIMEQTGVTPQFLIDGGTTGGNKVQRVDQQRNYMSWIRSHLTYLPASSPEEIILSAAKKIVDGEKGNSQLCKTKLHELATENLSKKATSEETDTFGTFLLGSCKKDCEELGKIVSTLMSFLYRVKN